MKEDLNKLCPFVFGRFENDENKWYFWYAMSMTAAWAFGVPAFILWALIHHNAHSIAREKIKVAAVNSMLDKFRKDTLDSGR